MVDFLDRLVESAKRRVDEGYYNVGFHLEKSLGSLKDSILTCKYAPIIAEVKFMSPSAGVVRREKNIEEIVLAIKNAGGVGISVLTEPEHFGGSLDFLVRVRRNVTLPILMKDIIISPIQLDAAAKLGVNDVLLVQTIFDRGCCEADVHKMIEYAQSKNLEVLLESHTEDEFSEAVKSNAELVGINNRDLKTLKVDLNVSKKILEKVECKGKIVVSESGIRNSDDVRFLHSCGAKAFLVGSAVMASSNVYEKVREIVFSYENR